jgi:hypothetical protein
MVRSLLELHLEAIDAWERSARPSSDAEDFSRLPDLIVVASRLGRILYPLGSANLGGLVTANPPRIEVHSLQIRSSSRRAMNELRQQLADDDAGDDRTRPAARSLFDEVLGPSCRRARATGSSPCWGKEGSAPCRWPRSATSRADWSSSVGIYAPVLDGEVRQARENQSEAGPETVFPVATYRFN